MDGKSEGAYNTPKIQLKNNDIAAKKIAMQ